MGSQNDLRGGATLNQKSFEKAMENTFPVIIVTSFYQQKSMSGVEIKEAMSALCRKEMGVQKDTRLPKSYTLPLSQDLKLFLYLQF